MSSPPHSKPTTTSSTTSPPRRRRDWSSLQDLAVFNIATRLDPIELLALAGVCKSWRTICTKNKPQILAHHPPLLLHLNLAAGRPPAAHLHTFPALRHYTKLLPPRFNILDAEQLSCSHGYVVLHRRRPGQSVLYLANPFSGHFVELPPSKRRALAALLTAPLAATECVVVAFAFDYMMVCRPGVGGGWSDVHFSAFMPRRYVPLEFDIKRSGYEIRQCLYYKGRVFIATHDTVVAMEIKFGPEVSVKKFAPFRIRKQPEQDSMDEMFPLCLFVAGEELFAVELELRIFPEDSHIDFIHRLQDGVRVTWEEDIDSLGGVTLFATNCSEYVYRGPRVMGRRRWGLKDMAFFVDNHWLKQNNGVGGMFLGECGFRGRFNRSPSLRCPFWVSPQLIV